ncbi:hypothetical protein MTP99_018904, partial [Tenebrio molitor]
VTHLANLTNVVQYNSEDDSSLLKNEHYQMEVENRIKFCIKKHVDIISASSAGVKKLRKWIPLFALNGILLFICCIFYCFLNEDNPKGRYYRVGAICIVGLTTFCSLIFIGQRVGNESDLLLRINTEIRWTSLNRKNLNLLTCYATFDRGLAQAEKVGVRGKMSFAATRKDVGSYPFRRGLTSQGSMNPGRAPRWSSAHCPRGVPVMKMTPLQASNLKQEDNLRPKKMGNTVNDTTEKGASPEHHVQIRPPKETTTTLSPGTLQHGLHYQGRVSRERGVDSEEQHTGCLGKN